MATYVIRPEDSVLTWHGEKRVGRKHHGTIDVKEGELVVEGEQLTGGRVVVDMATITDLDMKPGMGKETLEKHLKSDDFFDVQQYPTAELQIREVRDGVATVDLTIKGHTEPEEFPVSMEVSEGRVEMRGELVFDRSDFDVRYGSGKFFKGLGDELIEDDIRIEAVVSAVQG